jgi:microcystin-dependent protein
MSEPFLSEIRIMSFSFPPKGWTLCNGQLLPINQNQALFSLLGTTYGGDGRVNFALPNLQGQVPIHMGQGFPLGQFGGENFHTLTTQEMPSHSHAMNASSGAALVGVAGRVPGNNFLAQAAAAPVPGTPVSIYGTGAADASQTFASAALSTVGGSQPHTNQQPYLTLSFCIALQGIFPSQT